MVKCHRCEGRGTRLTTGKKIYIIPVSRKWQGRLLSRFLFVEM